MGDLKEVDDPAILADLNSKNSRLNSVHERASSIDMLKEQHKDIVEEITKLSKTISDRLTYYDQILSLKRRAKKINKMIKACRV